jgi:ribosomal protein L37AE/L43A
MSRDPPPRIPLHLYVEVLPKKLFCTRCGSTLQRRGVSTAWDCVPCYVTYDVTHGADDAGFLARN